MELARFKMKRVFDTYWQHVTRSKADPCDVPDSFWRGFFDFPRLYELAELEISLHSVSAACRVSSCVGLEDKDCLYGESPYPALFLEGGSYLLQGESIDRILKPLVGWRVYVQLEYIEGSSDD